MQQKRPVLGDGGYLLELERRGWVDSGSGREKVGTGKGSGQFTPEVAVEHPDSLRELHREFLRAGSEVLQALTFFGTREKLGREGSGAASHVRDLLKEQIAIVTSAGVDLLIMETFFHLEEMLIGLECARET